MELVNHLGPLTLPGRVFLAVKQSVGQVVGTHHRDGHEAGDLLSGAGKPEDGAGENTFAVGALGW